MLQYCWEFWTIFEEGKKCFVTFRMLRKCILYFNLISWNCVLQQTFADPLQWKDSQILQVLQLWREKVFKLCVQLRSKDIEMRREKDKLLIDVRKKKNCFWTPVHFISVTVDLCLKLLVLCCQVRSTEQQLQQEQHQNRVLQHSLQDRMAELDLERVEKEVSIRSS